MKMRARNIKPGLCKNENLGRCSLMARYLFATLPMLADREGRMEYRPSRIRIEIFPYDENITTAMVEGMIEELEQFKGDFIVRYEVGGKRYLSIINFIKHQNPHCRETASEIPAPPGVKPSGHTPHTVTPDQRLRILDRDGHCCTKCGSSVNLTIDHVTPRCQGGSNDDANLVTLCSSCNCAKGGRTVTTKDVPAHSQGSAQAPTGQCRATLIPDSLIPDSPILIPPSLPSADTDPVGFVQFWEAWPKHHRKANRKACSKTWNAQKLESLSADILRGLEIAKASNDWTKNAGEYIPAPLVWLNQRRWEPLLETGPVLSAYDRKMAEIDAMFPSQEEPK